MYAVRAKSLTAKLLATEDVQLVCDPTIETAAFDLKDRKLHFPDWKVSEDTENMLLVHETGHARHTPLQWEKEIRKHKTEADQHRYAHILNVLEDIRIDKLQVRRYPGAKKFYINSRPELFDLDFFKIKKEKLDVNKMTFVDRVNVAHKLPSYYPVSFTTEEQKLVDELYETETFDDVVKYADKLFKELKDQMQNAQSSGQSNGKKILKIKIKKGGSASGKPQKLKIDKDTEVQIEIDDSEDEGSEQSDKDNQNQDDGIKIDAKGNQSSDESDNGEESDEKDSDGKPEQNNDEIEVYADILTVDAFANTLKALAKKIPYQHGSFNIREPGSKKIESENYKTGYDRANNTEAKTKGNRFVTSMISTFNRKKRAKELSRTQETRLGVLDMRKLHTYKYNDDLFLTNQVTQDQKNHGFVVLIDLSSSMSNLIHKVLYQAYLMAIFCKKMGIPCDVYGFRDGMTNGHPALGKYKLIRFSSSSDTIARIESAYLTNANPSTGGTPLSASLVGMLDIVDKFRRDHKIDICNFFLLSDGGCNISAPHTATITDMKTHSVYPAAESFAGKVDYVAPLVQLLHDAYDVKTSVFYLCSLSYYRKSNKGFVKTTNMFMQMKNKFGFDNVFYVDSDLAFRSAFAQDKKINHNQSKSVDEVVADVSKNSMANDMIMLNEIISSMS